MHRLYAESLSEFGEPRQLTRAKGWILVRDIPGSGCQDAMGCYPLFTCRHWQHLATDLDEIGSDLVSLALVSDPFGDYDETLLKRCFGDLVYPFKDHYVVDLRQPRKSYISTHHRRYAQKSLRVVHVERCHRPEMLLQDWLELYSQLIARRNITGIAAFSSLAFSMQLRIPGIVAFRAWYRNETVGILLWYTQGQVGYYHLGAFSSTGYETHASFALFWYAIKHFGASDTIQWLDLGAGVGITQDRTDGLSRFKQGWSTGTRTAFFCGRVLDPANYSELSALSHASSTSYFPAYRLGEFT